MKRILRLESVVAPNGRFYIGLVLDKLNKYLNLKAESYLIDGTNLSEAKSGAFYNGGERISVRRVCENIYVVNGFPESEDFLDFRTKAQSILENEEPIRKVVKHGIVNQFNFSVANWSPK
ncbi:hypothetical protein HY450_00010 [Candidatus Pacearchaeota archaeon]|nr:hypothetical protein [Candidatus Pacearchaeota archaeon]